MQRDSTLKEHGLNLIRDLRLPPDGFDVRNASERELQIYGLPRRPDDDKHPQQAILWDSFAERPLRFVRPDLVPLTDRCRSEIRNYKSHDLTTDPKLRDMMARRLALIGIRSCILVPYTSANWSGAVVQRPASESLITVTGQWVVPNVSPPGSAWNGKGYNDGTYICAVWVGLDGWNGSNDVLQAGTASVVTVAGGVVTSRSYYAWIEWFGNAARVESDFPVSAGDAILCIVCAPFGNNHGTAMFTNQGTGLAMNYGIDPPAGVTLSGNVAEWIVEDPGQLGGPLFPFPNYGLTFFQNCSAGSKNVSLNLDNACPMNLVDASGKVISQATFNNRTSLTCNFLS